MTGVKIFGHRGACALKKENTLESIAQALADRADGVEIDIRLSADGVPVLLHDETLDRTEQGQGPVWKLPWEQLKRQGVASLTEVLDLIGDRSSLDVEMKIREAWPAAAVAMKGCATDVWISSFDIGIVEQAARDGFATGLLYSARRNRPTVERMLDDARRIRPRAFHLPADLLSADLIERAEQPVFVWTINDPAQARDLIHRGAAGIFSDDPGLMRRELDVSRR